MVDDALSYLFLITNHVLHEKKVFEDKVYIKLLNFYHII
jgi:hypothetical protein